jgi:hypothetical protein
LVWLKVSGLRPLVLLIRVVLKCLSVWSIGGLILTGETEVTWGRLSLAIIKRNRLMLCGTMIAVCSEIHTKHINTLCGQNVEFLNVKPGGI